MKKHGSFEISVYDQNEFSKKEGTQQICYKNSNTTMSAIEVNVCKFVNLSTLLQDAAQQTKWAWIWL